VTRVVIGSRNRVLATADTRFVSGGSLVTDFARHRALFDGAEAIVWAWYASHGGQPELEATLRGTEAILAGLAPLGLPLVFLSTDAVFSGLEGHYREDDLPDPQTAYGRVKRAQEQLLADFARVRFTTFGPSYNAERPLLVEMIRAGSATVDRPRQFFSPISTTTLNRCLDGIIAAKGPPRIYHLTSERISKVDCCRRLADAAHVALPAERTSDDTPLDLSLASATHAFSLADEIALATATVLS